MIFWKHFLVLSLIIVWQMCS